MKFIKNLVVGGAIAASLFLAGGSIAAETGKDIVLKGDAKCTSCHDEAASNPGVLTIGATKHGNRADGRTPSCTSCHGESEKHAAYSGKDKPPKPDSYFSKKSPLSAAERSKPCLTCHEKDRERTHWTGSQHDANEVACASCHNTHTKVDRVMGKSTQSEVCYTCHKSERAQGHKMSTHPVDAGKMACSSCHNPHGSAGPKLMKKNTVNETCHTCHAEKRGPYLFEHQPVTEDCLTCHSPHGSNISPLLKSRAPSLCDECHDGPHASGSTWGPNIAGKQPNPGITPSASYTGRACMNCHVQVHGSNSPAGGYLLR